MHRVRNSLTLPGLFLLGGFLLVLRYILRTPQPLTSLLPGSAHIYKWTHGHVFYKVHGNVDAPPLLLLHAPGIGASAHEMFPMMENLSHHYRVYAPDLLGFGLSDAPDVDYTADIFVALCQDFLRDVVQQPATLFARGLSCNYALAVAARSPELCTHLVLLSPPTSPGRSLSDPLSHMISHSTLLSTLVYALLTPYAILSQIIRLHIKERTVSSEEVKYAFASAHQLGAQYAALAFVSGKLNLDVRLDAPTQPKLLLWHSAPHINFVTQHTMNLPHVQAIFLNDVRYHIHGSVPQNVVTAIVRWQETIYKEIPVTVGTQITSEGYANSTISHPVSASLEFENSVAEEVENSQPPDAQIIAENTPSPAIPTVDAYCVKCKQKRVMQNAHKIVTKNGRNALEGVCPICNTKLFRFVS
ncbi:MAG: alpha/beta fold hydrolase [Ktedonobacteraceae bacterium]|nr:alpha/beta fold hydrolase [Ktedonobacteraceae bacterium]